MLAAELGKVPNRILIEGHTDAQPFAESKAYSNWELSADRANAARRLMEEKGLAPNQVVQIRGYADQDLRNKNNPEDPGNRRVTLIVRYLDAPKAIKLGALDNRIKQTEVHPVVNPAGLPVPHEDAAPKAANH